LVNKVFPADIQDELCDAGNQLSGRPAFAAHTG
jgi:hypothetical protein